MNKETAVLNQITRQLAEIKQAVAANDLVNRKVACEILDIDSKTFTNKKIAPDSINDYGQKFYSRKKLLGI
jgi:hypothetical protein